MYVHMMSALGEGGPPKADDSTDKLREYDSDKGGRGQNPIMLILNRLFHFLDKLG